MDLEKPAEPIAAEPPSVITLETLQQLARAAAVNAQGETINIEFTERIVQKLTPWMNDLLAAASPIAQSAPASAALGDRHFLEALIRVAQESFDPHVRAYGEQTARDIGYDCDSLIVAVDPSEAELSTLRERLRKAEGALRMIVATSAEYSKLNNLAGKPIWQNIAEETLAALGSAPAQAGTVSKP